LLTATVGVHLVQPWRILVAGPVNAGKSSLLNALVGYERAITSPQPGTTRDLVSVQTAFAGWPMQLTDTAGWRPDASGLEGQGIAKMLQSAADADLVLWVEDATQPALAPPAAIAARPWLRVCNKIDLCQEPRAGCLNISAQTGVGLACLQQRIVATLVGPAPAPDAALLFTPRQRDAVARARAAARSADWRGAAQELADLLGALETRRLNPGVP
jgi:tRNA modification GTPase